MAKNQNCTFNCNTSEELSRCYQHIGDSFNNKPENKVLVVDVEVSDEKRLKSRAQHNLYWAWVGVIADYEGNDKHEQHQILKRWHLTPVLMSSDKGYVDMVVSLNKYKQEASTDEYESLARGVAKLMSTKGLTVEQMSQYMKGVDRAYSSNGVVLPKPDNYAWITGGKQCR